MFTTKKDISEFPHLVESKIAQLNEAKNAD